MSSIFSFLFYVVVAYLIGSVNAALIISRLFDLPDPRAHGSQNPGATNVLRLAGRNYAAGVLIIDMLKGLLPVLLATILNAGPTTIAFTCLAAVIGHIYPLFFGFKGGKGVATALGALLGFHFLLGVSIIVVWILVAKFSQYSSLGSIVSMLCAPFFSLYALGNVNAFLPLMFMAMIVIYEHRYNITRLMDGKESKIHFHHSTPPLSAAIETPSASIVTKAARAKKEVISKPKKTPPKVKVEKKPVKAKKSTSKKAP